MDKRKQGIEFYGGLIGATIPFICLIVMLVLLTITKHTGLKCFWVAGLTALCATFLLSKDKKKMGAIAVKALTNQIFATTLIIFILAGVLSFMLRDSGLINGLLWLFDTLHINASILPVATFLVCVLISTSCGTQGGTISTVTPIMFPVAVQLGCDPALMLGAILSGAMFGDNLAPISDTTIASAGAFQADVRDVVRHRIRYSIIAGVLAAIMFVILGFQTTGGAEAYQVDPSAAKSLIMLVIPVIMLIMLLRGSNLISVLLVCNMLAFVLNTVMGFVPIGTMVDTSGPIVRGIEGMVGIIIFEALIFIQNEFLKESGALEALNNKLAKINKTPRQGELVAICVSIITSIMAGNSTASIVIGGPIVYELFKKHNTDRNRGAAYLDGISCGAGSLIPWNASVLILAGLAVGTGLLPESFSPMVFIKYSFHGMGLILILLICAITGLFRKPDANNYLPLNDEA